MPVTTQPRNKEAELRALDEQIAERKRYYRQQEQLIADLVETGNTQLMGLNHDILLARQELRQLKTEIRTAAQDKVLINQELDTLQTQISVVAVSIPIMPVLRPLTGSV